jgi:hypothetical protein
MEKQNQEKELDLLDLLNIFWKFFVNNLFKPFVVVLKIGIRKWKFLAIAIILGVAISVILPYTFARKNKSEIIVENKVSSSSNVIKEIEVLSNINRDRLSDLLEIDKETLKDLVAIKPHKVISKDSTFVTYEVDSHDIYEVGSEYKVHPSLFALEILSKDTATLALFSDAVLGYINEKSSMAHMKERTLSVVRTELNTFKQEAKVLDSLRYIQYFSNDANQVVLGTSGETFSIKDKNQWIQNDLISLKSRVITLQHALENDTLAVEPITTLAISDTYVNHPIKTAPKYALILFFLTYLVLIFCEYKKEIKDWINK